ncbi:MAG: hypothetical protein RIS94_1446 [Pseudomonadota bacterium]
MPSTFDPARISRWEPSQFDAIPQILPFTANDILPVLPDLDLWDSWPLAHEDGRTVVHAGRTWWFFLSAPQLPDPVDRHGIARIRLVSHGSDGWRDHGNALPDGLNPGTREWAGSAVLHDDGASVSLFYTVAGRRDGPASVEQRLFVCRGALGANSIGHWQTPQEIVLADGRRYILDRQETTGGAPGTIKGFRDPAWFRDPSTGTAHILFTASAAWDSDPFNGVIGMATLQDGRWVLDDPLIEAIGVNNELERPNVHFRAGRYYLFWSTQRHTFAPGAVAGPNGLYGAVADSLRGPWTPVNGNGLVAANPLDEPRQSYSWWVTGEDEVWSFVDYWGLAGRRPEDQPELLRSHFGGTAAPVFHLAFAGDRVTIVPR